MRHVCYVAPLECGENQERHNSISLQAVTNMASYTETDTQKHTIYL